MLVRILIFLFGTLDDDIWCSLDYQHFQAGPPGGVLRKNMFSAISSSASPTGCNKDKQHNTFWESISYLVPLKIAWNVIIGCNKCQQLEIAAQYPRYFRYFHPFYVSVYTKLIYSSYTSIVTPWFSLAMLNREVLRHTLANRSDNPALWSMCCANCSSCFWSVVLYRSFCWAYVLVIFSRGKNDIDRDCLETMVLAVFQS